MIIFERPSISSVSTVQDREKLFRYINNVDAEFKFVPFQNGNRQT